MPAPEESRPIVLNLRAITVRVESVPLLMTGRTVNQGAFIVFLNTSFVSPVMIMGFSGRVAIPMSWDFFFAPQLRRKARRKHDTNALAAKLPL
jgi:hypothetical protein